MFQCLSNRVTISGTCQVWHKHLWFHSNMQTVCLSNRVTISRTCQVWQEHLWFHINLQPISMSVKPSNNFWDMSFANHKSKHYTPTHVFTCCVLLMKINRLFKRKMGSNKCESLSASCSSLHTRSRRVRQQTLNQHETRNKSPFAKKMVEFKVSHNLQTLFSIVTSLSINTFETLLSVSRKF